MTDAAPALELVGQDIRGYRFDALIAQGGFGQVYRAFQPVVGRHVAIKVIHPSYANQPNFVRRFELEAQLVAQLEHPHVVPLYDFWRDPTGAYLVMRLLRGSLTDLLDRFGGPLSLDMTARMLDQIAAALTAAHRNGIIHRDLKPANVLLDDEENAYLADFGIAKRLFQEDESEFERFGSPAYVAPEQVNADVVSAQTDIYSLGIIVYEMLTGTLPFNAPSQTLMLQQHLTAEVPAVTGVRPDLPEEINYVIRRATQRQPKDRYADALMMAQDFRRLMLATEISESKSPPAQRTPNRSRAGDSTGAPEGRTKILNIAAVSHKNPYKGLRAFQEADAVDFFGRESIISRLVQRLRGQGVESRMLVLVGPSGSGKSSLARAGLLPALRRGAVPGAGKWVYPIMTPGTTPLTEFEQAVGRMAAVSPDGLAEAVRANPERVNVLLDKVLQPGTEFALVIDQFEEVFSLASDEDERSAFLNMLVALARNPRARVIMTLRADFYDRPLLHPAFGDLVRDCTEVVLPLSATEMEAAIVRPAERLGVTFEPGLTARIIQDVSAQPGALPLLQYVLYELFEQRTSDILTQRAYDAEGGVYGALARRAEAVYAELEAAAQQMAQRLFLRLIVAGETAEDTRRRMKQSELTALSPAHEPIDEVIEAFGRHRLLTFDRDSVTREPTIEIAHEALIRQWSRLRDWIDTNRAQLRLRQQLTTSASEWDGARRENGFLARGGRLISYESLEMNHSLTLNEVERDYLRASLHERQREQRRTQRSVAALTIIALLAVVAAVGALILQNDARRERDRADRQARVARADELAITAFTNLPDLDRSLLLSMEALSSAETFEARNSLLLGLQFSPHLRRFLHGAGDGLRTIDISPDGRFAAAAGLEGRVLIWDLQSGQMQGEIAAHEGAIYGLGFSPDGRRIATGGADATVRVWDVLSLEMMYAPLTGHTGDIWDVIFSPDGSLIASASEDSSIRLWDAATGQQDGDPLLGHTDIVFSVSFRPDGTQLASGSADQTVRIWDIETHEEAREPLVGHENWVYNVTYRPDGSLLASTGADALLILWDVADDYRLSGLPIRAHLDQIRALAFSRDGRFIATGSRDQTVRVWDVATREPLDDGFAGHTDEVRDIAFGTFGRLISVGNGGKVLVWNTTQRTVLGRTVDAGLPLIALAMSGDGSLIAGGGPSRSGRIYGGVWNGADGTQRAALNGDASQITALDFPAQSGTFVSADDLGDLRLWETSGRRVEDRLLQGYDFVLKAVAFSQDGSLVATGGDDDAVYIVSTADGAQRRLALGPSAAPVYALAFNADATLVASGDDNGQVYLWDVASGAQVSEPITLANVDVTALAFSPDGTQIAVGDGNGGLRLYDVVTGASTATLLGHTDWITQAVFDSTGTQLASASHDTTVRVWDVRNRRPLVLRGHTDWVFGVAFQPDGNGLVSGGRDGRIVLWDTTLTDWRARACSLANRNLTQDEWDRFFPGQPYRDTCGDSGSP